jgi:hypothetical protein
MFLNTQRSMKFVMQRLRMTNTRESTPLSPCGERGWGIEVEGCFGANFFQDETLLKFCIIKRFCHLSQT